MEKIIITSLHPYLKEGIILERTSYNCDEKWYEVENDINHNSFDTTAWMKKGWCKKYIEEKLFTISDLQDIIAYYDVNSPSQIKMSPGGEKEIVKEWLKFANK